jgi:hypothetical protein
MSKIVKKFRLMVITSGEGAPNGAKQNPSDKQIIEWLYGVLTVLDSKAGALLAFDGLLLAAASLMYDKMSEKVPWLRTPSLLLILVTLFAALLCLFVAQVSYHFLGKITLGVNNDPEIETLGKAAECRTRILWVAWRASVFAVCSFIAIVIGVLFKTLELK